MFKVQLDINGYWTGNFATLGELTDSVEVENLPDISESLEKRQSYKYDKENAILEFDEERYISLSGSSATNRIINTNYLISSKQSQMVKKNKENLEKFLETIKMKSFASGEEAYYTVSKDKQNELTSTILAYQLAQNMGIGYQLKWNTTGETCTDWTIEQISQLALEMTAFVTPYIEQQRETEKAIYNASTLEELNSIDITFSIIEE